MTKRRHFKKRIYIVRNKECVNKECIQQSYIKSYKKSYIKSKKKKKKMSLTNGWKHNYVTVVHSRLKVWKHFLKIDIFKITC